MIDTILTDYVQSLKFILFNKLKTNNVIIDAIITTITLSLFAHVLQLYETHKHKMHDVMTDVFYLFAKPNRLIITGRNSSCPSSYGEFYITSVYSDRFISLLDHIIHNVKSKDIFEVKELFANYNNEKIKTNEHLVVSQKKEFLIDKNLYAKIKFEVENIENDKKSTKIEIINIEIYSYVHSIEHIRTYVDNIVFNYRKNLNDCRKTKQFVYTAIKSTIKDDECKYNKWNEEIFHSNRHFDNLFLENKRAVVERIEFFLHNKDWYDDRGIPYNLGIGLHGPPGTGKTSFIKALANKTKRDIVVIPLAIVKTKLELNQLFYESTYTNKNDTNSRTFDKKIIVFEDIDCIGDIVKNRNLIKEKEDAQRKQYEEFLKNSKGLQHVDFKPLEFSSSDPLSLDDFLNLWDGVLETPGRIIVLTSNFYNELDPALIRPGRIDITYEFKNVSHSILQEIHNRFYGKEIDNEKLLKIKEYFYSPAEVLNIYMTYHADENAYIERLQSNVKIM